MIDFFASTPAKGNAFDDTATTTAEKRLMNPSDRISHEPPPKGELSAAAGEATARQQALVSLGRRAVAPPDVGVLLQDAAALVAEMLHAEFGIAAQYRGPGRPIETHLVRPQSIQRSDQSVIRCRPLPDDPHLSLCAFAINAALPMAVVDLAAEQRFDDRLLPKHGIVAATAAPLKLVDRALGAIGAGATVRRTFGEEDILFLETVSHLVTATIARSQAEQYLAAERRLSEGLFDVLEAIVLILDHNGLVVRSNPACHRATGFSADELDGRRLEATLAMPEELHLFHHALGKALATESSVEFESRLLTKHGQQRNVAWTLATLRHGPETMPSSVIVTGIDVTRERQLEARLTQIEKPSPSAADPVSVMNIERRRGMRRSYPYRQMIAPLIGNKLPELDQFFPVMCNDISAGGFSFLIHQPLPTKGLVVALGVAPQVSYLTARVVHVSRVDYQGHKMFLIGCCYTGRANY